MADIFLSYATPNRDFVDKIRSYLEERGKYSTWMDHHKILPGDDWGDEIESNVRNCKVFIVTVSEESSKSSWVKRECLLAENLGKPRIPILKSGQLPFSLMDLQYIDFTSSKKNTQLPFNSCIRLLLEVLKQHISNPSGSGGNNKIRRTLTISSKDYCNPKSSPSPSSSSYDDDDDDGATTTTTPISVTAVPITTLTSGKPYWGPLPTSQAKMAPPDYYHTHDDECQPSRPSSVGGGNNRRRHPKHQEGQVAATTHQYVDRLQTKVYPDLVLVSQDCPNHITNTNINTNTNTSSSSSCCLLLSRSGLAAQEKQLIKEISRENKKPVQNRNFEKLQQLQTLLDGLKQRKQNEYPNINELKRQFDELIFQIELASTAKDYTKAKLLQKDLNKLELTIQRVESSSSGGLGATGRSAMMLNPNDIEVLKTRASLEAKLMQLNEDYNTTFNNYDFSMAQQIVDEMNLLKKLRKDKPSRADYAIQAEQLIIELQSAKLTQNLDAAKTIHKRLVLVQSKELTEKEAEIALGIQVGGSEEDGDDVEIVVSSPPPPPPPPPQQQLARRQRQGIIQPTKRIGQYAGTASAAATKENSNGQVTPSGRDDDVAAPNGDDFAVTREEEKAAMGSRFQGRHQQRQQSLDLDDDYKPGAIAIDGPRSSSGALDGQTTMTEETSQQEDRLEPVQNVVTEASLVDSIPIDMEQQILDVLQRNAVQAVAVEKVVNDELVNGKKGIVGRLFLKKGRRWGLKKKSLLKQQQSKIVDDFFGFDR